MNKGLRFNHILSLLLILGMITAGISPACQFVSGKSTKLIEICTVAGLQKIPAAPEGQTPVKPAHDKSPSCAFCFAAHNGKVIACGVAAVPASFIAPPSYGMALYTAPPARLFIALPEARAPPSAV